VIEGLDIARFSIFEGLNPQQIEMIAMICEKKAFPINSLIFQEGDIGDNLFLIASGNVKLFKFISPYFDEALIYLDEGDVFGEMSFIDRKPRSCHAVALTDCEIIAIKRDEIDRIVSNDPQIGMKVFSSIASISTARLRLTNDKFKSAILRGLEMCGAQVMALHYILTERVDIEICLKNGMTLSGRIMLVSKGDQGYEVTIKDRYGKLHIIPYHAINYLSSLP
jgi:CRP-like cAMP-binding protein